MERSSATGAFTSNITGLMPGTLYHVRAYATNAAGTSYGVDVQFTTQFAPTVTTQAVTNISTTTATGNGNITSLGIPNPTQHGVVWSTSLNPTIADSKTTDGVVSATGAFTSSITGLTPGTLYHVRAYATNAVGTSYGEDVTFIAYLAPTVTTQAVTNIGQTTAIGNGNVTVLGVPNPTEHGIVWATTANPTIANSKTTDGPINATGAFTSNITGLSPNTTYHVRAYATNAVTTVYGSDVQFTTGAATQVTFTSSGTWTAPAGVTSVTVEVWGGGGRGALVDSSYNEKVGGGGGGGAYSMSTITVVPGTNYSYTVGAGATTSAAAGDSYFINTSTVLAQGGNSAADESSTGATGGPASTGVGTVKYSGGNGANGNTTSNYGGGGGSSAGTGSNGTNATNATGATAPTGGGNGGNGRSSSSGNGSAGLTPGGGGGGAYRSSGSSLYNGGNGANGQIRLTYTAAATSTTTSINCGAGNPSVIYGSSMSCVATVARNSGTSNVTGTVSWTSSGAGSFTTSPCTLSGTGGSASCTVNYTPSSVGNGSHLITAHYSGDTNYLASSGNQTVTVNKKAASVTPNVASKVYGNTDPTLTGTLTGFLAGDNVTAIYSRVVGENVSGSPYAISATLNPTGVLANYNITYNTANFTINQKDASVTPNAASKTFGEADPELTGTLTGFLPADNVTATYGRMPGETVEGSPYTITAALRASAGVLDNYNITYNTAAFMITAPQGDYTLTIDITGNGTVTKDPEQTVYHYGDVVTLTATPDLGWSLGGWSENVVDGKVTIHGDTTVNATFTQDEYTLTIEKTGNGAVTKSPDQATYHYGDEVTLTATPDLGWNFGNWSPNVVDGKVTIHDNTTVTATFTPIEYILTINISGNGTVAKDPDNVTYHEGDEVTLTATPDPGWSFDSWSANVVDGKVTIHGDTAVTATFKSAEYTLTILSDHGMVAKDPDKTTYQEGEEVTLTVTADLGWAFSGWSGDLNSSNNPDTVTIHDNTTVTANYTSVEAAPSFTSAPVITVDEDIAYIYNITATDPNTADTLTITAPTKPDWLTFTDNGDGTATLTGTPTNAEVGSHDVVLQVSDGSMSTEQPFGITVVNTNDAPSFTSEPVTMATAGSPYSYNITVNDPDLGAVLAITAPVKPEWLTLTDNGDGTAVLSGTPGSENVGINDVTLRVNDGVVDVDQTFTIDVGNSNEGPSFTSTPVTSVDEDTLYTYNITTADPDLGDTLTITAPTLPAWLTFTDHGDRTATLTGTPTNSEVGDHQVELQVTDGHELANQSFTITVVNVNDAPVLTQPADQTNEKGNVVSLQLSAMDVDLGDSLTYSASGLPDGLNIDPVSGLISGTITADADTYLVTAGVDDGHGGTDSKTFNWVVTESAYTLTVNIIGNGTVTKDPDQSSYLNGTEVNLTATPDNGWTFDHWSANVVGGKVTINGDTTVTVTFMQTSGGVLLGEPTGTVGGWDNTFHWTGLAEAEYYQLEVYDSTDTMLVGQWFTTSICTGLNCAASPTETANLSSR